MRAVTIAALLLLLTTAISGCGHTYDGSQEFSNQMPQYNYNDDNPAPAYMHPADGDPNSP
jgi:hypothetical protein